MNDLAAKIGIRVIDNADLIDNKYAILSLLEDNYKINFSGIKNFTEVVTNNYNDMVRFNKDGSAILIGAYSNGTIVGFLWAHRNVFLGERRVHLAHIVVKSNFRRNSVGTQLLHELEKISQFEEINKIELMASIENEQTIEFYKSMNYRVSRVQLEKSFNE